MVNYKRIVCEVSLLVVVLSLAAAAPAEEKPERHYDQRQNGTENYRLNIDGVVIAIAPAESFLAAASDLDISDILGIEELNELYKPKPPSNKPSKPDDDDKPQDLKPDEKPGSSLSDSSANSDMKQKKDASQRNKERSQRLKYRLANMLLPLLRRNRHH